MPFHLVKPGVPDASTGYSAVRVLYGSYQSDSREALFHLALSGLLLRFARRKPALEPFLRLPNTWTKKEFHLHARQVPGSFFRGAAPLPTYAACGGTSAFNLFRPFGETREALPHHAQTGQWLRYARRKPALEPLPRLPNTRTSYVSVFFPP